MQYPLDHNNMASARLGGMTTQNQLIHQPKNQEAGSESKPSGF